MIRHNCKRSNWFSPVAHRMAPAKETFSEIGVALACTWSSASYRSSALARRFHLLVVPGHPVPTLPKDHHTNKVKQEWQGSVWTSQIPPTQKYWVRVSLVVIGNRPTYREEENRQGQQKRQQPNHANNFTSSAWCAHVLCPHWMTYDKIPLKKIQ